MNWQNRMTKERLSRLQILRREITRTKKRIAEIQLGEKRTKREENALIRLDAFLKMYLADIAEEAAELVEYITNIEDLTVREIFMLRYYDGIDTWQKVAFKMGEYDESFVRKKHNAYLNKIR